VAPSWVVSVSAAVNLPLHHKVQKFLFWHRLTRVVTERGPLTVVVVVVLPFSGCSRLYLKLNQLEMPDIPDP